MDTDSVIIVLIFILILQNLNCRNKTKEKK